MPKYLAPLLTADRRPRILVVGDVMLDRYLFGDVERISPEAPIPVLRVERQEHRLGGAGSVAAMLAALQAEVAVASVVGDDAEGEQIRRLLAEIEADTSGLVREPGRPSTVKQRMLGRTHAKHAQQMLRVDREQPCPIDDATAGRLLDAIARRLPSVDLVLLSDYDKGVCSDALLRQLIEAARAVDVGVVADPVRGRDYHRYAGCAGITPNRTEASLALQMPIVSPDDGLAAAQRMLAFGVESAIVTLDRDGIAWADRRGDARLFPVRPRQVYDITGAGDMVLSALGYGLAAGADWPLAIELANLAGGLEVERLGVVPLTRRELLAEIAHGGAASAAKILDLESLLDELRRRRSQGQRVAMTNGCFDLLHPGHVASLEEARRHGDLLVVGLNSDRSTAALKGPGHPILDQAGRAAMLAALAAVDYVVVFDEVSVAGLIEQIRPEVLVKSAQYRREEVVGHEIVDAYGGRIVLSQMQGDYSTTALIERIRSAPTQGLNRK